MTIKLPKPDLFGNYWLAPQNALPMASASGPAIFPSKRLRDGDIQRSGYYFVSLGEGRRMLWDGMALRRFGSAAEALAAVQKELGG